MKIFNILIILFLIILSFNVKAQQRDEYNLAQKTLEHYNNIKVVRLLEKPNNDIIQNYLNGFRVDTLDFSNVKFSFCKKTLSEWSDISKKLEKKIK
jgi:hypothetical protein